MTMKKHEYAIGIDLGGTNVKYALIDSKGVFHFDGILPSMAEVSAEAVIGQLAEAVSQVKKVAALNGIDLKGAGIGTPGIVDEQTPVYGHHMNNRSMFYEIDDTVDQAAFDKIEAVYYITRDATYRCTPLMTCVIDETFLDARQANFSDTHSLADYLREMRADMRAEADDAEERIATVDQVLTLITCSGELPGADRTVMVLSVDEQTPSLAVSSQG